MGDNKNPLPENAVGVFTWDDCETCFCLIQVKEEIDITRDRVTVVLERDFKFKDGIRLTMTKAPAGSAT